MIVSWVVYRYVLSVIVTQAPLALPLYLAGTTAIPKEPNFNDGISSDDGLIIASGTLTVNAVDDGIRGKDYLVVENGDITVNAGGDGLKSDNEEAADRGYILVENGVLNVTACADCDVRPRQPAPLALDAGQAVLNRAEGSDLVGLEQDTFLLNQAVLPGNGIFKRFNEDCSPTRRGPSPALAALPGTRTRPS